MRDYQYYKEALQNKSKPCLFLDKHAFENNIQSIANKAGKKRIRIATKSIRSVSVLHYILESSDVFQGLMCFTAEEALFLYEKGFQDLLIAYPVWETEQLGKICQANKSGATITLMVDSIEHIERLEKISVEEDGTFRVCLDVDLSMTLPGLYFGVYRSSIRSVKTAISIAKRIQASSYLSLDGVMGYEAQIAGVTDADPNQQMKGRVIRQLKRNAWKKIRKRRKRIIKGIERAGIPLRLVNGGGTGSLKETATDKVVTEVTVGSGFFNSHLFDKYKTFQYEAALGFAIEITRQPEASIYTCLGGGYVASGPAHQDKTPEIFLPEGAQFIANEGAGEVQTPIRYKGREKLQIGDPVFLRHSKAGEICERFHEIAVIQNGKCVESYATYRGEGKCFL